jgi:hypothetical protein
MIALGNPFTRVGEFGRAFEPESPWSQFKITAMDAPHMFHGHLVMDPVWLEDMRKDYGPNPEQNPVFQVEVMAEFPSEDDSALFPMDLIDRASVGEMEGNPGRHMGVDLARFGSDKSVAILLVNGRVSGLHSWAKLDTMASANIVAGLMQKWRVAPHDTHLDDVGVGGGTVDRLRQLGHQVDGVGFGEAPSGDWHELIGRSVKLENRRAELHWVARRLMETGGLSVPSNYHQIRADLAVIPYGYNKRERLAIPEKKTIKAKLGRSTDFSDALTIALSRPGRTRVRARRLGRKGRARNRPKL